METEERKTTDPEPLPCPECGCPVGPDERFCQCGWEREEGEERGAKSEERQEERGVWSDENDPSKAGAMSLLYSGAAAQPGPPDPQPHSGCDTGSDTPSPPALRSSLFAPPSAQQTTNHESQTTLPSDCDDFRLEYNQARIFLVGSVSSFNFRLTPVGEDAKKIREIELHVESPGYLPDPLVKPSHSPRLQKGRFVGINLNMVPEQDGIDIGGEVYLRYRKGTRRLAFCATFEWDTYPPSVAADKVVENLSVRIGNVSATADRAGDAPVILRFLDNIRSSGRYSKAEELRQLKIPKVWNSLCLADQGEPQPPEIGEPPLSARQGRLTLEAPDGHLLHLIHTQGRVHVGRNRRCDIVTWFMTTDGSERLEDRSENISKYHCRLEKAAGKWMVCDGNGERSSSYGTFLNGSEVPATGGRALPMDEPFTLWLAGRKPNDPKVFRFEGRLWTCAALGRCKMALHRECKPLEPACLILKRTDGIPETFLLLWRFCPVEAIDESMKDTLGMACIFRHRNAYAVSEGRDEKAYAWLIPGAHAGAADSGVEVGLFRQFGKWAEGTEQA